MPKSEQNLHEACYSSWGSDLEESFRVIENIYVGLQDLSHSLVGVVGVALGARAQCQHRAAHTISSQERLTCACSKISASFRTSFANSFTSLAPGPNCASLPTTFSS